MNVFDAIQFGRPVNVCEKCAWFSNDPAFIEQAYPGLTIMSSGFASVRHKDGFCNYKGLYLSATDTCACFTPSERTADMENKCKS